jgi:hypothetical protein
MRKSYFSPVVACCTVVAFAGCSGAGTQSLVGGPIGQQNTQQSARGPAATAETAAQARVLHDALAFPRTQAIADHRESWMAPEARTAKRLLYVADEASGNVSVFAYPKGKPEGVLSGFNLPSGICTNHAGNVFVLNGGGSTVEVFAHGGTQVLRTLQLPGAPWFDCSVDPQTGNLAVSSFSDSGGGSVIAVFKGATGTPTTYSPTGEDGLPGCAYDNAGNLFCNAFSTGNQSFGLYEVPKGSQTVKSIAVTTSVLAGSMQWDGKYLAFTDGSGGTIEQLQVSGSSGSIVGSTSLNGTGPVWQFWIPAVPKGGGTEATRIIAPTYVSSDDYVGYWAYPGGGNATKRIGNLQQPDGAALSVKP